MRKTRRAPRRVRAYPELQSLANSTMTYAFTWTDSALPAKDVYLVNGQMQPRLAMASNTWIIFDVVNAVGDHVVEVEIRNAVLGGALAGACVVAACGGLWAPHGGAGQALEQAPASGG